MDMASVLVSPLSWGLGHASRDMPIIRELMRRGHDVTIAAGGRAYDLLKKECPDCQFIHFEDYPAPYSSTLSFMSKFFVSIPVLLKALAAERKAFGRILSKGKYDAIISDSRPAVYSEKIPSFYITHQLRFSVPSYIRPVETASQYVNGYIYKKFGRVIIPDNNGDSMRLSGKLCQSSSKVANKKSYYAGIISTLHRTRSPEDIDFLAIISGPEPQRTELEKIILRQVRELPGEKVVLLGRPDADFEKKPGRHTTVKSYVSDEEKNSLMNRAKFIISRSGYTTMMDIAELGKKHGLFTPTPGQTEQEYLSKYYAEKGWFYSNNQYDLKLLKDTEKANGYSGFPDMPRSKGNVRKLYKEVFAKYMD